MTSVNQNSYLCIVRFSQRQIINTSTNFNNSVFQFTAVFGITNLKSLRIHTFRINKFRIEGFSIIVGHIIFQRIDILKIINFFMLCSRRTDYPKSCLFTRICYLIHSTSINRIAFHLQHIESFIQFLF